MSRLCLDTSAYSNFRRGDPNTAKHIDRSEWIGMPTVVLGELWTGFLLGRRLERNVQELGEFLSHESVQVLGCGEDVARIYGEIIVDLRRKGLPLPSNDVWIAAIAVRAGATVLTFDAHFRQIGRVGALVL